MKISPVHLAVCLFALLGFVRGVEVNPPALQAVTAADDRRVEAFKKADAAALAELLSEQLHYAHASGKVDTKASLTQALGAGSLRYLALDYTERTFTFPAPGIVLMHGRLRLQVSTPTGQVETPMSFLGVWRLEGSQWRFLAWQSSKIPAETKP